MNKLYKMPFDSKTYEAICNLLTDYECDSGDNFEDGYWEGELYEMLVDIQRMMAEVIY